MSMNIGVIGAGRMAGTLATRFAENGHQVLIGARRAEEARDLAMRIGRGARWGTLAEAAEFGPVVLLAVKRIGLAEALRTAGAERLAGRTLIDCNNLGPDPADGPPIAREIQALAPAANVVKAFNCCHFHVWQMTPPAFDGRPLAVPLCGDSSSAKEQVSQLIGELGCRPVDWAASRKPGTSNTWRPSSSGCCSRVPTR